VGRNEDHDRASGDNHTIRVRPSSMEVFRDLYLANLLEVGFDITQGHGEEMEI
jgi:hypothetical protein